MQIDFNCKDQALAYVMGQKLSLQLIVSACRTNLDHNPQKKIMFLYLSLLTMKNKTLLFLIFLQLIATFSLNAQNSRIQVPQFIARSYLNLNIGHISTPLSAKQLENGYQAESIESSHLGIRLVFLGYRFNEHLSGQVSYWKPVSYTLYKNINGDGKAHSVWIHQGTLTLKSQIPVGKKLSLYGEAGFGIVTRKGFKIDNADVVKSSSDANLVTGAGLEYHISKNWDLIAGTTYSPGIKKTNQPHTIFHSAGIKYNLHPLTPDKLEANAKGNHFFPHQLLQFGYSTKNFGYGVNNFFSKGPVPIFWGGKIHISKGAFLKYQRNIFHTKKFFSFDIGTSIGWWQGDQLKENIYTISAYPLFRFSLLRTKPADFYFNYCVAGPSYISKTMIDKKNSGRHFTFQDFMGIGMFAGKNRHLNAEVLINHYSNGNIFPDNAGLKIPLTFTLGYAW